MDEYSVGEYIIYRNGEKYELGRIKSLREDGAFVAYHEGETGALTPYSNMHKLINRYCIKDTSLGGDYFADRKTENSSEKPNNCEHITEDGVTCAKYPACDDCLDNPLNKVKGSERLVKCSEQTEPTISKMEQVDKDINVRSKDEPTTQTETQNSNLTFKTLEYCDICDHKGCEECIANALDEHCIPSQFKKQIEDECAKEYEELGLKELKELIKADRKTEQTEREGEE